MTADHATQPLDLDAIREDLDYASFGPSNARALGAVVASKLLAEVERLRGLVGDENQPGWDGCSRAEAIRQAEAKTDALLEWVEAHDARRDERDDARAEMQRLRAIVDGAEVREEWGTRLTWPGGKTEDRWCYRDRDDAAAQVGWFAEQIPHAVPGGSLYGATATLIRRLHLTLAAETVEE